MTSLLIDTSVLIKWFHSHGESEVSEARALLDAHREERVTAHVLDLAVYEVGNVLTRSLQWPAGDVTDQLRDLLEICGLPLVLDPRWLGTAATLAELASLTFYDACWAAAAKELGVPLVSADRQLVTAGLAVTPAGAAARWA